MHCINKKGSLLEAQESATRVKRAEAARAEATTEQQQHSSPKNSRKDNRARSEEKTIVVSILIEDRLVGLITIANIVRDGAEQIVGEIRRMGK